MKINIDINIQVHRDKKIWYKYIIPKRLTLKCHPRVHRWLFWVW